METALLDEIKGQIETLYADRGADFTPSARYRVLLNLEATLLARLQSRHTHSS
jgi:hypothetical protein